MVPSARSWPTTRPIELAPATRWFTSIPPGTVGPCHRSTTRRMPPILMSELFGGQPPAHDVSFRSAVSDDFRESRWWQRFLLLATLLWIIYEWGAGNEMVTPWLLVRVVSETTGLASVAATALVGFLFTACQQLLSGFTASAGFSMFPRTARSAWAKLKARLDPVPGDWATMRWPTRALVVFTLGTTAVVLLQVASTGETGVRRQRRTVVQAAMLVGGLVGFAGAVVAALVWVGREVSWLQSPTDWLLRVLGNPLFWIGMLAIFTITNRMRPGAADGTR
jgi:hypothetical protein